ncbi:MAG: sulfatase [Pirellulales bacterium]|nr:sulfatase [Pirellulales bacterium]
MLKAAILKDARLRFVLAYSLAIVCGLPLRAVLASEQGRPNILFIYSDDHAYQAISAYGSNRNKTPNIDSLARDGMLFDRCLVTNSICGPCRAVILTGKYSHLNGFTRNDNRFDGTQQTFPKLLRQAGYQTAMIGKWHLASDPTGFDYWKVLPGQGAYYNPDFKTAAGTERLMGYCTDIITDIGLQWLQSERDPKKPFMMMLQHKAPHREWAAGPTHLNTYDDVTMPEPETLFDDYHDRPSVIRDQQMTIARSMTQGYDLKLWDESNRHTPGFKRFFGRFTDEQKRAFLEAYAEKNREFTEANLAGKDLISWKYQRYVKDYLRCIASVDENVGRVLDYLKESGLGKNTIVIYSSDQGFYLGEHGWFDKRWIFEQSLKTPLLVRWPGVVEPGSRNDSVVSNLDFAETFLDIAGATVPADMQGHSLLPLIQGHTPNNWRQTFYYHYYETGGHGVPAHFGVVTDRHKLVRYYETRANRKLVPINQWELIDYKSNPEETVNFLGDPTYAETKMDLRQELRRLQAHYQVPSISTNFPNE